MQKEKANVTDDEGFSGNPQDIIESGDLNNKVLESKLQDYEKTINSLQEENKRYKDFINSIIDNPDYKDLLTLAKSQWKYVVRLDDKPVPPDGNVEVNEQEFQVVISEIPDVLSTLPTEIISKGKISGNYFEHIKFLNCKPNRVDSSSGMLDATSYTFSNILKGSIL